MVNTKKFVLFTRSSTQRVVVEVYEDSVLIAKEWRKFNVDDWIRGKGITIPRAHIIRLGKMLEPQEPDMLTQEENHDTNK